MKTLPLFGWLFALPLAALLADPATLALTTPSSASSVSSTASPASSLSGPDLPLATLLEKAAAAEAAHDTAQALLWYEKAAAVRPADGFILQKVARQYSDSLLDVPHDQLDEQRRRAQLALAYAERAVAADPQSAVNVLSLAICHGKLGALSDTRTKVRLSILVRQEAERALALDPRYDWAYHILGRWHREVSNLGSATRWLVRMMYDKLPPASLAEATRYLRQAVALAPQTVAHHVELANCLLAQGEIDAARASFTQALALPAREKHDASDQNRARAALAKLAP